MGSIKEELLIKARRDTTKLVQVQRSVSRNGKTFMQNFWVKPSEVKSTDRVIGGQQNLLPAMGSVPKPAAGVLDSAYFDMLAVSDKSKALDYLKSCGVIWNEHNHAGINWMRAKQALTAALGGQKQVKVPTQANTQQPTFTQTSNQNNTPAGQKTTITLDKATQDELSKCKNGREKVVVLKKKLGNDGCAQYAESLGVTWDKNAHAGINWMRLSAALREHFDSVDGTVSATVQSTPKDKSKAKSTATQTKANADEIEVPKNATQRQKNIVELINKVTDPSDLKAFTSIGMIPEDDTAKSYILEKLVPKYAIFAASHATKSSGGARSNAHSSYGFADQVAFGMKYEGCDKSIIKYGLYTLYNDFNMALLTDPRTQVATVIGDSSARTGKSQSVLGIFDRFRDANLYTTDEYAKDSTYGHKIGQYMTNLGYTGCDSEVYKKRYDKNKEGFVVALQEIVKKYPQYKNKCDEMIEDYDSLMKKVGGNPQLLDVVLSKDTWTDEIDPNISRRQQMCGLSPMDVKRATSAEAKLTLHTIDEQYNAITKVLQDRGYSDEEIFQSLNFGWGNDDLTRFTVRDSDGYNNLETFDLAAEVNKNGTVIDTWSYASWLNFMADKWSKQHNLGKTVYSVDEQKEAYNALKQRAEFTSQDYLEVQELASKLFGYQFTTVDANTGKTEKCDLTKMDSKTLGTELSNASFGLSDDPDKDFVMSNLMMMQLEMTVNREIAYRVGENRGSAANKNGYDFSGNYSYYAPTRRSLRSQIRGKAEGNRLAGQLTADYTLDELNQKIRDQVGNLMTYSPEYIKDLQNYYNAKSNFQDRAKEAKRANFDQVGIYVEDYISNPIKDIAYGYIASIARSVPKMSERGTDKLNKLMAKRMNYAPYDFKSVVQRGFNTPKNPGSAASNLRTLREEAFKATNCTIATEDDATSLQMRKDFLKNWDYTDGKDEKTPDGIVHNRRMYSGNYSYGGHDRRALFNSRFFRINNSNMEDDYDAYHDKLTSDTSLDASASEELELYHACSYASVAGIIGKTGGWFMGDQYTKVAKALGNGAYFGYKGAKSSVYCGEGSGGYHNTYSSGANGDNANGCYILATCMRGKDGDSKSDHGRFRDYEIAIKTNKCIKPHHFVDISSRCMNVNVSRDSQGNYLDPNTGKITHDRYGKSVNMQ